MSDKDELIAGAIVVAIVAVLALVIIVISSAHDNSKWNNGCCDCGGKWVYQQAVGHQYTTGYLYECDKCGKTKEFDEKR